MAVVFSWATLSFFIILPLKDSKLTNTKMQLSWNPRKYHKSIQSEWTTEQGKEFLWKTFKTPSIKWCYNWLLLSVHSKINDLWSHLKGNAENSSNANSKNQYIITTKRTEQTLGVKKNPQKKHADIPQKYTQRLFSIPKNVHFPASHKVEDNY